MTVYAGSQVRELDYQLTLVFRSIDYLTPQKKFPLSDVSSIRLVRPDIRSTLQVLLKNCAGMTF